jgi:glycosyltransferase involved in cell wall biosynthesis
MPVKQNETLREIRHQQLATQKVAYILSSFPLLSETFILQEILELERQGLQIHIFSCSKPSTSKGAEVVWNGQTAVTYISQHSKLILLINVIRYILKTPIRFMRMSIPMVGHCRLKSLIGSLVCATFVAAQLEHEDITHLHAHFATEATSVALFTHLLTGIPYSFTAHAYDIYLSSKTALVYKMQMARFVVTGTAYNQRYLTELVDQDVGKRIHCIYSGLNFRAFPDHPSDAPLTQASSLILSVGRLIEKKGLLYLLYACRILADQGYKFTCYIVGDGPLRQALEQKIRELALCNQVDLLGGQTHKQVIEMYQKATIMALPCIISESGDRDGLPDVLLESLYMGVPVVSTPVSGIPELITSQINGLLVPPNDSAALASELARLLDDPSLRCRLAAAGRKTVLERFDIAHKAQCLIRLFCPHLQD